MLSCDRGRCIGNIRSIRRRIARSRTVCCRNPLRALRRHILHTATLRIHSLGWRALHWGTLAHLHACSLSRSRIAGHIIDQAFEMQRSFTTQGVLVSFQCIDFANQLSQMHPRFNICINPFFVHIVEECAAINLLSAERFRRAAASG